MSTQPPTVTFWGAARTVTGTQHLLEADGNRILLDCGLYQGRRDEARVRNSTFPFDPKSIDGVILSHAHIDHCGNLPNLVKQGFHGPIFCTPATADLLEIMLLDSAHIQEEDADWLNRKRHVQPRAEPLYRAADVADTLRLTRKVGYGMDQHIGSGIDLHFVDAGHLLGSAMVSLTFKNGKALTFTGDLGRRGLPILRDPGAVPPGDVLISESTYGDRIHPPVAELADDLAAIVQRTAARGGRVLIPAFALGRTQAVLYYLHQLMQADRLPDIPVYVDSPLAANATEIFQLHPECFDAETGKLLRDHPDLFGNRRVEYTRTVAESKRLNESKRPCIVIAASGMCENGRIRHHLKNHIEDARNMVAIIGFQAPDTLGRRLVERQPKVKILDGWYDLRAEVVTLNGFSSHADRNDFLAFLAPVAGRAKKTRLVHGEPGPAAALAAALRDAGFADVAVPDRGESVTID